MKILLYLYQYGLTIEGFWNCLFFPNMGERLFVFPFLSEDDKKSVEMLAMWPMIFNAQPFSLNMLIFLY